MKRFFLSSLFLLFFAAGLLAESAWVGSARCGLMSAANGSSARIGELVRGTQVILLGASGSWVQVQSPAGTGWVMKLFLQSTPPGERVSILGSASTEARLHARSRASASVTAASARGLLDERSAAGEARARGVETGSSGDLHEKLLRIEGLSMSEEELLNFLKAGGIRD